MQHLAGKAVFGLMISALCFTGLGLPALAEEDSNYLMVSVASAPEEQAKNLQAKVVIDAPPQAVWNAITNYPQLKNVLPGYEKSAVIKNGGSTKVLDIAMKVAAFLPTYKYQVQVQENEANRQLTLKRVSGDFKSFDATYSLTPQDGGKRTLLVYKLKLDTGFKLPGAQAVLKSSTEKSLRALEKHVEQEHRKSVIGQR